MFPDSKSRTPWQLLEHVRPGSFDIVYSLYLGRAVDAFCSMLVTTTRGNTLQLLLASSVLRTLNRRDGHVLLLTLSRGLSARSRLVLDVRGPKSCTDARGHCVQEATSAGRLLVDDERGLQVKNTETTGIKLSAMATVPKAV